MEMGSMSLFIVQVSSGRHLLVTFTIVVEKLFAVIVNAVLTGKINSSLRLLLLITFC